MKFVYASPELSMPSCQQLSGDSWLLTKPFCFIRPNGRKVFVPPAGIFSDMEMVMQPVWTHDYASIPMLAQCMFRKDGAYAPAYVLHDWMYTCEMFSRSECDWIMLEALQHLGAWWLTRNTIYSAVRAGGWAVWQQHDPKRVKAMRAYHSEFMARLKQNDARWTELARLIDK